MRIGFVTPFFSPRAGGAAIVPYNLAIQLTRSGHEVFIFTSDMYRDEIKFPEEQTLKVRQSKCRLSFSGFYYSPGFIRSLQETANALDILHFHNFRTYQNIVARRFALEHQLPYVLQAHGTVPRSGRKFSKWIFDKAYGSRIIRDASALIALTQQEVRQYVSMQADGTKTVVIPNGIDVEEYTTLPAKGRFRTNFGIGEGAKIILYLGRIHKGKGIDFLIRAFAQISKEAPNRDTVLVVAGPDDGYMNEAKRLAGSLRLDKRVIFTGMLSEQEKKEAYVDARVVVNVEPANVYGLVPLEAAACSAPVILCKGNAMAEIVHDGGFGSSVSFNDIQGLASECELFLDDEDFGSRLGRQGRAYVLREFDWSKIVGKLEAMYRLIARS